MPRQTAHGYAAYSIHNPVVRAADPQVTEGWALIEAARRLAESVQTDDPTSVKARVAMRTALRTNLQLWTIFQASLMFEETNVPEDIRMNMLTLAQFVDRHTVKAMADPTPEQLVVLININRNIGAGLLGSPEDGVVNARPAEAEAPAAPAPAPVPPQYSAPQAPAPAPAPEGEPQRQTINERC